MGKKQKESHFFSFLKSIVRDTTQSIERNNVMSVASILSIVAALIILGIFVIFSVNLEHITTNVESALELKVYMKSGTTQEQVDTVSDKLRTHQNVSEVTFVSADQALNDFSSSLQGYSGLLSGYNSSNNPMAASFDVKISDAGQIGEVKNYASSLTADGVDYVKYGEEYVNALVSFSHFTNIFCGVLIVILSVVSLFIIYNTIKLTCFARRREIRVMRYVGAPNWYIRVPFVLEGTLLGCLGALVAVLLIRTGYYYLIAYVQHSVYLPMNSDLVAPGTLMSQISLFCVLYGVIIGSIGSLFSMRKFLDV
ncbi:MAG: permease-like cell division protein FtsX [Eubacteriaceae bacterium]|nr:permease-like cell division protein FtsX [Eubacteriaceae bacterium]